MPPAARQEAAPAADLAELPAQAELRCEAAEPMGAAEPWERAGLPASLNLSRQAPIPASAAEDRKEWANRVRCRSAPDRDVDSPEELRAQPGLPVRADALVELRGVPARLAGLPEAPPHELGAPQALLASTEPTLFPWVAESDACRPAVDAKAMDADGPLRFPPPSQQAHSPPAPLPARVR